MHSEIQLGRRAKMDCPRALFDRFTDALFDPDHGKAAAAGLQLFQIPAMPFPSLAMETDTRPSYSTGLSLTTPAVSRVFFFFLFG